MEPCENALEYLFEWDKANARCRMRNTSKTQRSFQSLRICYCHLVECITWKISTSAKSAKSQPNVLAQPRAQQYTICILSTVLRSNPQKFPLIFPENKTPSLVLKIVTDQYHPPILILGCIKPILFVLLSPLSSN